MALLLLFGINSTTEICDETVIEIYNDHLKLDYNLSTPIVEKTPDIVPKQYESKTAKITSYTDRYKNVKLYSSNSIFIENFIESNKKIVKEESLRQGINPANMMATIILEQVNAKEERYGELAEKYFNWGSIKVKSGEFFSDEYKAFLVKASNGSVFYYDDCKDENGKRVKCEFYKFRSNWYGMVATIRFLGERIKNPPSYAKEYGGLKGVTDYEEFAYKMYTAGYADINEDDPHDMKIVRIIRQYDLENM